MIDDLLKMFMLATQAKSVEFVLFEAVGDSHESSSHIGDSIGATFQESAESLYEPDTRANGPSCNDWVRSLIAAPVTGPSAEYGWLVAAHPDTDGFDDRALDCISTAVVLIEHELDRTLEHGRIAELSRQIRDQQNQLRRSSERLELSNRELEQFAYIAAHELVAPLRAVAIYADVLESVAEPSEILAAAGARECATEIQIGIRRMTEQVQYLLSLSKVQVKDDSLDLVSVRDIVDAALDSLAEPLGEVDAQVSVGSLPFVEAKAVPLQSVFANLVTNSIRYRSPGQPLKIEIGASDTPEGTRISVSDNGLGIREVDQSRVFEMFERASTDAEGSGIGLAVSRRILEGFGATIEVAPKTDAGSTFWLLFPG